MMMRIIYILLFFCSLVLSACGQKAKVQATMQPRENKTHAVMNNYIPNESKDIDRTNYAQKVYESVKHYDKEPVYYFRVHKQNCLIEIYINDVNNYGDFELSNVITPIRVGHILKSGKQHVKVKMYPVGDLINQDLGLENAPPATTLSDKAQVTIEVVMMDNKSQKKFDDEKLITKQVSPKETAGKECYEFTFTFDAEVPYEFEGWTKGQDLRKLDPDLVHQKALEYYRMVGQLFLQKDLDSWLKIKYPFQQRIAGMYYWDKQYLDELVDEVTKDVNREYKMLPFENYTVEYMGDEKLLRLVTNSQKASLRGGGALYLTYGKKGVLLPGITLYLPKGRDLKTQGFMMWK